MSNEKQPILSPLFSKENYTWMAIGGAFIVVGLLCMLGGKNVNVNTFDKTVIYSFTRITLAPVLIIIGFVIEIYAIFKKSKS
jgi:Protein of unknown function (DUF3098)